MQTIQKAARNAALAAAILLLAASVTAPAFAEEEAAEAEVELVELDNGDTVHVTVVERTEEGIVADHPVFGRITIPNDKIKVEEPDPVTPGLFGTRVLRGWDKKLTFGFNGSSGNSDSIGINAGLELFNEADWYRARFRGGYFFANQRTITQAVKEETTNNGFVDYRHDFLIFGESPFFLWGNARYDYDRFQDFEHRIAAQAGAGWDAIKNDAILLAFTAGAGVNYSTNRPNAVPPFPAETKGELVLGVDFDWKIVEGQMFTADTFYYPNFEDFSDFRILSSILYEIDLGWIRGLALNVGLKNEYRNQVAPIPAVPAPGDPLRNENNNLQYYGGLTYNF